MTAMNSGIYLTLRTFPATRSWLRPRPAFGHYASALQRRSFAAALTGLVLLTVGVLVKYLPLFLWPVLMAAALREQPRWRERRHLLLAGGLASLVLVALAYAPFWVGWETLRNFSDRRGVFAISWIAGLWRALVAFGATDEQAQTIAVATGSGLLLLGTLWATWQAWRRPREVSWHILLLTLWFMFACNPAPQPWYIIWPLAFVAIQPWRERMVWGIILCCGCGLLSYVVSAFVAPIASW